MTAEAATRKLAAIVAADIAGYSRLVAADEEVTLASLRSLRSDRIEPAVARHRGRIANTAGDSLLMEFPSVVEALRCAIEIQTSMAEWNAGVPRDRRIEFRVGINLGDVIEQDGDLLGDGVNVAARLEGIADPGGIALSASAYDQAHDRVEVSFADWGARKLKNIPTPVHVYAVDLERKGAGPAASTRLRSPLLPVVALVVLVAAAGAASWWVKPWMLLQGPSGPETAATTLDGKPSIAVLPFANLSDDKEQEYFSDGMTDDLITDLSKSSSLLVISRNSTFSYKDKSPDIHQLGRKLGARYILQGSVRRAGDTMRINVRLTDSDTGKNLWAERYDGKLNDVFALQDRVTGAIVSSLALTLTPDEARRIAKAPTHDSQAYDLYLRGLRQQGYFTKQANIESRRLLEAAITRDPAFASAYAALAQSYSLAVENHWTDKAEFKQKAVATAKHAIELDPELPYAYWSLGRIYTRPYLSRPDLAISEFQKAIALNPNYADGYMFLAIALTFTGHAERALSLIEKAMRLNPAYPFWYLQGLGMAQFFIGDYKAALRSFKKAVERNPAVPWLYQLLIATYGKLGMTEEADWAMVEFESLGQPATIKAVMKASFLHDPTYRQIFEDGLRKAGMQEE